MRRYSLASLAFALTLALAGPGSEAKAAYIDFAATPSGGTVAVGAQTLGGTVLGLNTATLLGGPAGAPGSMATAGASLVFTTGSLVSTDARGDKFFGPGGTITLLDGSGNAMFTGQFTGTADAPETELQPVVGGLYQLVTAGFAGQLRTDVASFFGLSNGTSSAGALTLTFGVTGSGLLVTSADVTIDPNPQGVPIGVPEPASIALVALGLPLAGLLARRARKSSR